MSCGCVFLWEFPQKNAILGRVVFGQLMRFCAPPAVFGLWLLGQNVADYRPVVKGKRPGCVALQK